MEEVEKYDNTTKVHEIQRNKNKREKKDKETLFENKIKALD